MDNSLTLTHTNIGKPSLEGESSFSLLWFNHEIINSLRQHRGHLGILIEASLKPGQDINLKQATQEISTTISEYYYEDKHQGGPLDALQAAYDVSQQLIHEQYMAASFFVSCFAIWGNALLYLNPLHRHIGIRRSNEFFELDQDPQGTEQIKNDDQILIASEMFWQKVLTPTLRDHQDQSLSLFIDELTNLNEKESNHIPLLHAHITTVEIDSVPSEEEIIEIDLPHKDTPHKNKKSFKFSLPKISLPFFSKPKISLRSEHTSDKRKWFTLGGLALLFTISISATYFINNTKKQNEDLTLKLEEIDATLSKASSLAHLNPQESLNLISKTSDLLGEVQGIRTDKYDEKQTEVEKKSIEIYNQIYNITQSTGTQTTLPLEIEPHIMHITETGVLDLQNEVILSPNNQWENITVADRYFDNIYILDTKAQTIWRYIGPTTPQTTPSNYLRESTQLTNAKDLAIDGSIYILFPDAVQKFTTGSIDDFSVKGTHPPFMESSRISTLPDIDHLYISANNTIMVFEKSGLYLKTIKITNVSEIQDIAASINDTVVYILSDGLWFEVSVSQ